MYIAETMHVLQSRIGLKECFVRPFFLNFPIPYDTDNTLIKKQMIVTLRNTCTVFAWNYY